MPSEDPVDLAYFLTTWGRAFCAALEPIDAGLCGQDAYEVFVMAFGDAAVIPTFRSMTQDDLVRLRDAARTWLETSAIETDHLKGAVAETRWHWGMGPMA